MPLPIQTYPLDEVEGHGLHDKHLNLVVEKLCVAGHLGKRDPPVVRIATEEKIDDGHQPDLLQEELAAVAQVCVLVEERAAAKERRQIPAVEHL